jgi:hypothetical protein
MRRASVVGCRARVTTVSAGRERGENLPPPHRLGGDHWNYVVRSGLISLKGTRRLLAQPPLLRPPALRTSPAVPSGAFLRVGGEILQPWLMSPSTRAAHRLGFEGTRQDVCWRTSEWLTDEEGISVGREAGSKRGMPHVQPADRRRRRTVRLRTSLPAWLGARCARRLQHRSDRSDAPGSMLRSKLWARWKQCSS